MPTRPLRPCTKPGCKNLVSSGRCREHKDKSYDNNRQSSSARGYGRRWQKYRRWFLSRNPICACGCGKPATDVDHIQPVSGPNDPLFWDMGNHQALTHECHSRKTAKHDGGYRGRGV